jgi:ATP-dependent protease ClpP protease subunit
MDLKNKTTTNAKVFFGQSVPKFLNKEQDKPDKKSKKRKRHVAESEGEEDDETSPFVLPGLLGGEDEKIYIKENHLYFHTGVDEDSVDSVKKLMRAYAIKFNRIRKTHTCVQINPKPLYLHIYSPGGDVYAGLSLYDYIMEYREHIPVYTVVEGLAASAATFISVAGSKRFITPSSYMLIHQLSTFMHGNFEQLKDEFDNSKKLMEKIMGIYETHTSITKKRIPKILKHDLIWDADECAANGLVDEIKLIDLFNDDIKSDDESNEN